MLSLTAPRIVVINKHLSSDVGWVLTGTLVTPISEWILRTPGSNCGIFEKGGKN